MQDCSSLSRVPSQGHGQGIMHPGLCNPGSFEGWPSPTIDLLLPNPSFSEGTPQAFECKGQQGQVICPASFRMNQMPNPNGESLISLEEESPMGMLGHEMTHGDLLPLVEPINCAHGAPPIREPALLANAHANLLPYHAVLQESENGGSGLGTFVTDSKNVEHMTCIGAVAADGMSVSDDDCEEQGEDVMDDCSAALGNVLDGLEKTGKDGSAVMHDTGHTHPLPAHDSMHDLAIKIGMLMAVGSIVDGPSSGSVLDLRRFILCMPKWVHAAEYDPQGMGLAQHGTDGSGKLKRVACTLHNALNIHFLGSDGRRMSATIMHTGKCKITTSSSVPGFHRQVLNLAARALMQADAKARRDGHQVVNKGQVRAGKLVYSTMRVDGDMGMLVDLEALCGIDNAEWPEDCVRMTHKGKTTGAQIILRAGQRKAEVCLRICGTGVLQAMNCKGSNTSQSQSCTLSELVRCVRGFVSWAMKRKSLITMAKDDPRMTRRMRDADKKRSAAAYCL